MTTFQLTHSLARHLKVKHLGTMPAETKLDILHAINAAMQIVYSLMPSESKITTVSGVLKAPATVSYALPAKYSTALSAPAFSADQQGCTAVMGDDSAPNEITGPSSILDQFLGSQLTGLATVYGDAIPIYAVIERVISDPICYGDAIQIQRLVRDQQHFRRLQMMIGRPMRYALYAAGQNQGATPPFFLRVWPMPDRDYKVRFEAEISSVRVTFDQITQTAATILLSERLCESALLPLARAELTSSPDWEDKNTIPGITAKAAEARAQVRLMPGSVTSTANLVHTPWGF